MPKENANQMSHPILAEASSARYNSSHQYQHHRAFDRATVTGCRSCVLTTSIPKDLLIAQQKPQNKAVIPQIVSVFVLCMHNTNHAKPSGEPASFVALYCTRSACSIVCRVDNTMWVQVAPYSSLPWPQRNQENQLHCAEIARF